MGRWHERKLKRKNEGKRRIKRREEAAAAAAVVGSRSIQRGYPGEDYCGGFGAVVSSQDGCNGFDNSWTLIMFSSAYSYVRRGGGKDVKQRRSDQA